MHTNTQAYTIDIPFYARVLSAAPWPVFIIVIYVQAQSQAVDASEPMGLRGEYLRC